MMKRTPRLDPVFLVLHPALPTMASGAFASEDIEKIHGICKDLEQGSMPIHRVRPVKGPGWLENWTSHWYKAGKPLPELPIACDPEGGPDPDRLKFALDTCNSNRLGSLGAAIGLAIATDLDRKLPDRKSGSTVIRRVTDLQLAVMYAERAQKGPPLGYYDLMLRVWQAEMSWFSRYGINTGTLT